MWMQPYSVPSETLVKLTKGLFRARGSQPPPPWSLAALYTVFQHVGGFFFTKMHFSLWTWLLQSAAFMAAIARAMHCHLNWYELISTCNALSFELIWTDMNVQCTVIWTDLNWYQRAMHCHLNWFELISTCNALSFELIWTDTTVCQIATSRCNSLEVSSSWSLRRQRETSPTYTHSLLQLQTSTTSHANHHKTVSMITKFQSLDFRL